MWWTRSSTVPDAWGEGGHFEPNVTLTLIALAGLLRGRDRARPVSATGVCTAVLTQNGAQAVVQGDHPVRGRLIVSDTSGNNQLAAELGFAVPLLRLVRDRRTFL